MKILLARSASNTKPKSVDIETIEKNLEKSKEIFVYLDRENEHKDLNSLLEHFENLGKNVLMKEIKHALGELDFLYEVHIY